MKRLQGVLLVIVIAVGFGLIAYKSDGLNSKKKPNAELETITKLDLENAYPESQIDVLDLFCRITKEFYNKENSEKDIAALANKMRHLFAEQLLVANPYDKYMDNLLAEIKDYKSVNRVIIFYKIDRIFKENVASVDGVEMTSMRIKFDLVDANDSDIEVYEKIVLVKEEGKWKVLGWSETEPFDK